MFSKRRECTNFGWAILHAPYRHSHVPTNTFKEKGMCCAHVSRRKTHSFHLGNTFPYFCTHVLIRCPNFGWTILHVPYRHSHTSRQIPTVFFLFALSASSLNTATFSTVVCSRSVSATTPTPASPSCTLTRKFRRSRPLPERTVRSRTM